MSSTSSSSVSFSSISTESDISTESPMSCSSGSSCANANPENESGLVINAKIITEIKKTLD